MKYLNPKADLTFKKVFGENSDLVISFLNALLPFKSKEEEIKSVEYLDPELVPLNPLRKDSIVDVRCRDQVGRQFIVEMQMMWTSAYKQRVLFNASKAYVSQLDRGHDYKLLHPVYSLNLVNDTFSDSENYYHDYQIVERADTKEVIDGLRFIFIELPKFTPKNYSDKKMEVLWLRYLTEINEHTSEVSDDLRENPEINKAVTQLEESGFSELQLLGYEKFWDIISTQKMQLSSMHEDGLKKGMKEGLEKGLEKGMKEGIKEGMRRGIEKGIERGIEEGKEKGILEEKYNTVKRLKQIGLETGIIAQATGLSPQEVESI